MKRGPPPIRGFDLAIPVALMRGSVMLFRKSPWYACDFTINGNGIFSVVRLRMARRIRATIDEIAHIFSDAIADLAAIPSGGPLSRELWLYSRHRTLRFFRLGDAGLVEIDCYGMAFVNGRPVISLMMPENFRNADPARMAGSGAVFCRPGQSGPPGPAGSSAGNSRSVIFRWLAKRDAGKNTGTPGPVPGRDGQTAGSPGPKKDPATENSYPPREKRGAGGDM